MTTTSTTPRRHERWEILRHAIIGPLLAAPPDHGRARAGRVLDDRALAAPGPQGGRQRRHGASAPTQDPGGRRDAAVGVVGRRRSRLCCHAQWYLDETAETLVHGLSHAIQKRRRPQQLPTDNGSAMTSAEAREA